MKPNLSAKQAAALSMVAAVAEAIRELGSVPSGHLCARLMNHMDLAAYQRMIGHLKNAGLVSESADLLTWTGPFKGVR